MKTLAFVLVCCATASAGTFTRTASTTSLLVPRDTNGPSITFDVTHTYDEDTLQLLTTAFDWSADVYKRTTYVQETMPAVFPEPPQVVTTPIEETLRILDWDATAAITGDVWGPRYVDYKRSWIFSWLVDMSLGSITVERTLTGPESSETSTFEIPAGEASGFLENALTVDGWQPLGGYVMGNHNQEGPWVPEGSIDGFTVPAYYLTQYMPVVPEPSGLAMLLWAFCLLWRANIPA